MNNFLDDIFNGKTVRASLAGVLIVLILFLLAQTITVAQNFGRSTLPATDTITVNGEGQATVAPDIARVSFTVQNTAATVADAQAATTKQANAAIEFVKQQGIAEADTRTLSYNISPQYAYTTCPPGTICPVRTSKVTGYQVSETIQVKIRKLATVGAFLEGLGKLSVQNVSGPNFGLEDSTTGYDAARADAITKAKAQAQMLAKQLGVHLGKIVHFSESSGGYPGPVYMTAGAGGAVESKAAAPTVPVGENTYNASVTITYEIY